MTDPRSNPENKSWRRRMMLTIADFWKKPLPAEPLAMCRIVTALTILIGSLAGIAPNLHLYWSPEGVSPAEVADQYLENSGRISLLRSLENLPLISSIIPQPLADAWRDVTDTQLAVNVLFSVWMLALVLMAVGFYTRTSTIVAWLLTLSFHHRMIYVLNGGDDVSLQLLFYLMLTPSGAAWSIDSLRRRLKSYHDPAAGFELPNRKIDLAPAMIRPWSVRLMQIQICCIYFFTGLSKMNIAETNDYLTGEAVYWTLNDICLTRWSYAQLPVPMWICRLLSWGTLLFEFGFIPFVMIRRLRPWLLVGGFAFHLGILLTMEIGWFGSQYTLCFYPLFLSAGALRRFVTNCTRRLSGGVYTVFYDTFCPVCRRSRLALESLDMGDRLEFRDIHDRKQMQRDLPEVSYTRALREMIVQTPSGRIVGGFDAFRVISRALPALWPVVPLLYVPGVPLIGRKVYHWIAQHRYKLVKCDDGVCSLHLQALAGSELDEEDVARIVERARASAANAADD